MRRKKGIQYNLPKPEHSRDYSLNAIWRLWSQAVALPVDPRHHGSQRL